MPTISVFNGTDASMDYTGNQMRIYEDKAQNVGDRYWEFLFTVVGTMDADAKITVYIEFFSGNSIKICDLSKEKTQDIIRETKKAFAMED